MIRLYTRGVFKRGVFKECGRAGGEGWRGGSEGRLWILRTGGGAGGRRRAWLRVREEF